MKYANESDGRFADETDDPNRIARFDLSDIRFLSDIIESFSPPVLFPPASSRLHSWLWGDENNCILIHTRRVKVCNLLA